MNDRKLAVVIGILRSITELCAAALAILEPDEMDVPEPDVKPQPRYFGDDDKPAA